jgi:hypothetical protein
VQGHKLSDTLRRFRSCLNGDLYGGEIASNQRRRESGADCLIPYKFDESGFHHGVRRFGRADETTGFDQAQRSFQYPSLPFSRLTVSIRIDDNRVKT